MLGVEHFSEAHDSMSLHAHSLFGMQRSAIKDPGMGSLNANTRVLIGK